MARDAPLGTGRPAPAPTSGEVDFAGAAIAAGTVESIADAGDVTGDGLLDVAWIETESERHGDFGEEYYDYTHTLSFAASPVAGAFTPTLSFAWSVQLDRGGATSDATLGEDLDGDGAPDLLFVVGASSLGPGAYLLPLDGTGALTDAEVTSLGGGWPEQPEQVESYGDLDGDGFADVLSASLGMGYAVAGPLAPGAWEDIGWLYGLDTWLTAGDLDGDGVPEAIARWGLSGRGSGVFAATLPLATTSADSVGWLYVPDLAATTAAVADVDGDGADDLVLGVSDTTLDGEDGGGIYVLHGPIAPGSFSLGLADRALSGSLDADGFGGTFALLPDRGAGLPGVAVGATDGVWLYDAL